MNYKLEFLRSLIAGGGSFGLTISQKRILLEQVELEEAKISAFFGAMCDEDVEASK